MGVEVVQGGPGGVGVQEAGDALLGVAGPEGGQHPLPLAGRPGHDGAGPLPLDLQHGEGVLVDEGGALRLDDLGGLAPGVAGVDDAGRRAALQDPGGDDGDELAAALELRVVEGGGHRDPRGPARAGSAGSPGPADDVADLDPGRAVLELLGGVARAPGGVGRLERPGGAQGHGHPDLQAAGLGQDGGQGLALGGVGPEAGREGDLDLAEAGRRDGAQLVEKPQ